MLYLTVLYFLKETVLTLHDRGFIFLRGRTHSVTFPCHGREVYIAEEPLAPIQLPLVYHSDGSYSEVSNSLTHVWTSLSLILQRSLPITPARFVWLPLPPEQHREPWDGTPTDSLRRRRE